MLLKVNECQKFLKKELLAIAKGHKLNPGDEVLGTQISLDGKEYWLVKGKEKR
jgi:hypothetical protein